MVTLESLTLEELHTHDGMPCTCGKRHFCQCGELHVGRGELCQVPGYVKAHGAKKAYLLADRNTWAAAGKQLAAYLAEAQLASTVCLYEEDQPEPDEHTVGKALLHFDTSCDMVIAVGGGVMNDVGKMLAAAARLPYMIVATAPSMDGFASATSSMSRDGLKVSIPTKSADIIVCDLDILSAAPMKLIVSGIGDMAAKYISICEWRIAHELVDEYYCPHVAALVKQALQKCVSAKEGILRREPEAVRTVVEGLILCGIGMNYAGLSRPASGMEHYISHIWDMQGLSFGSHTDLHGIQCGIGTVMALKGYAYLLAQTPDKARALSYAASFDESAWEANLRGVLGAGAEAMIAGEKKEHKYDRDRHARRLERILSKWDTLCAIMREELPAISETEALLRTLGAPVIPEEGGFTAQQAHDAFLYAKDIRDKYVLGRLLWDLGLLEDCADTLFPAP